MSGASTHSWSSPFSAIPRWEVEYPHFYHLATELQAEVEAEGSLFLLGTRGTGKTTLLRSLDWEERATNPRLQASLGDPFGSGLIGLYQKVPEARFSLIAQWYEHEMHSAIRTDDRLGAAYLDSFSVQLMAAATRGLLADHILRLPAGAERRVVEPALAQLGGLPAGRRVPSLLDLEELSHRVAQGLEDDAEAGTSVRSSISHRLPGYKIGRLGRTVAKALAAAITVENPGPRWRFRHTLDEAESLSPDQLRSLSSLIRLSQHSLSYIAAFTHVAVDPTATDLPRLPLAEHDVRTISLDTTDSTPQEYQRTLARFRNLAIGVLRVRLEAWDVVEPGPTGLGGMSDQAIAKTMSDVVLPRWSIDERLEHHVTSSDVPLDHPLLSDLSAADPDPYLDGEFDPSGSTPPETSRGPGTALLTYRAFLRARGFGESHGDSARERQQDNAEFRKRMVAAYLVICDAMRWDPIYCGWEEILQLSDLCIRDFLWQMRELWREAEPSSAIDFLSRPISPTAQSRALKAATAKKVAFSRKYLTISPARTRRMIEGLAILTHELQADSTDPSALASPERGEFTVRRMPGGHLDREVTELLSDAARQGYIKVTRVTSSSWNFRVHRCIAPLAAFSYRRPQYAFPISMSFLQSMSKSPDEGSLRRVVAGVDRPDVDQISLFDGLG